MFDYLDSQGVQAVLEAVKGKIPTSLPANGGNADTVDNKHAADFYSDDNKPYLVGAASLPTSSSDPTFVKTGFKPSYVIINVPTDGMMHSTTATNQYISITNTGFNILKTATSTASTAVWIAFK